MAKKTVVSAVKRSRKMKGKLPERDRVHVITPEASESEMMEDGDVEKDESMMDEERTEEPRVWLPGMELAQDEVLEPDMSVYVMLQEMQTEWPCLSFDALHNGTGREMHDYPMEASLVAGTQADRPEKNKIFLMRWTNLRKNQDKIIKEDEDSDEGEANSDAESSDSESESESEMMAAEGADKDKRWMPRCHTKAISHADGAGVNRIRALRSPDASKLIVSTWSERGKVLLWDLSGVKAELDAQVAADPMRRPSSLFGNDSVHLKPLASLPMRAEGFALDWSPRQWGSLLSGDCSGAINFIQLNASGDAAAINGRSFAGHSGSVEDLQWSPAEATVFASASCDQTVRIWDVRCDPRKAALIAHCHESDVNVISWNRSVSYLLASGGDDGSFKTWDLRNFAQQSTQTSLENTLSTPVATFKWHLSAVTSIEWHPTESSVLAVSGADDQISLWDFAVENDREANAEGELPLAPNGMPIPPHLLFVHQGQREVKEIHWHPQSPGVVMSTAGSGFNIFKTISI